MLHHGRFLLCCVALLALIGCSGESDRQSLEGTVTLDGEPLSEGAITFRPMPGTEGPTAGGPIRDGQFSIASDQGTFAGTFRVEISAHKKTGRKIPGALGGEVDETVSIIPERYNRQSELTADVEKGAANEFEFELTAR